MVRGEDEQSLPAAAKAQDHSDTANWKHLEVERFRLAFERAAIGIGLLDLDGRFLDANRAVCEILGYSEGELIGRSFAEITHADDVPHEVVLLARLLAGEVAS
jgi:PAS domain S-box-containing protein